ncbi:MAG: EscU/YscU/HrcU family type III secretion system export apparatus switch protein [Acidobacteria bacterium]|nr:EscU/YscU/HrcU family type III secretion system export apparatus switch protein [Acidobacteriota bacterium]
MSQNGERTEQATPRRLEKAREDGKIVSSRYLVIAVQFIVAFFYLSGSSEDAAPALKHWKTWLASSFEAPQAGSRFLVPSIDWTRQTLLYFFWAGAITSASMLASQLAVSQGYFSIARAKPDFSKVFSVGRLRGQLKEGLKSLRASLVVIFLFTVLLALYWQEGVAWSAFLPRMSVLGLLSEQSRQLIGLGKVCCLLFLVFGAADLMMAMRKFNEELKMTKQELKEEYKEGNGNPEVKAKIRRIMKDFAGKRMMSQVPKATVVITNPTHYAIAIQYESGDMAVPIVLAKGVDHVALRIRKIAMDREIPIIENPPLAQALYKSVEVGQEIPMHLYRAVAEVLAYVYRVLGRTAAR